MKRKYEPRRRVCVCKVVYEPLWHRAYAFGNDLPGYTFCRIILHDDTITWKPTNRLPLSQDRCPTCFGDKQ